MPQCMEKYKNKFAIRFAKVMEKNLFNFKVCQKEYLKNLYTTDIKASALMATAITLLIIFGNICSLIRISEPFQLSYIKFTPFYWIIIFVIAFIRNIPIENKKYQKSIKKILFPKLLTIFTNEIQHKHKLISAQIFDSSNLLKKKVSNRFPDDFFNGIYNNIEFNINEIELTNITSTPDNKSDITTLFKGIALNFTMSKSITKQIFIYSKKYKKTPKGYEKVELEDNKFCKKYNVFVQKGGQIEARYLLTTAFLDRFMQLQMSFKVKDLKCSVWDNNILFLLSTNKDLFEMNHLFGRIDDVHQYDHLFDEFASVLSFIDVLNLASKTGL